MQFGEADPASPTKPGHKQLDSSNSGCETDEDEGELGMPSLAPQLKREEQSKRKYDDEELKRLGSTPESTEGGQNFGKSSVRCKRRGMPPPGLSDDDFADLDY